MQDYLGFIWATAENLVKDPWDTRAWLSAAFEAFFVIASLFGVTFGAFLIVWAVRMRQRPDTSELVIGEDGIADQRLPLGTIPWKEIATIELIKRGGMTNLALRLKNSAQWASRLSTWQRRFRSLSGEDPPFVLPSANSAISGVPGQYLMWLIGQRQPHLASIPRDFDPWKFDIEFRSPQDVATAILRTDPTLANALVRARLEKATAEENTVLAERWQRVVDNLATLERRNPAV